MEVLQCLDKICREISNEIILNSFWKCGFSSEFDIEIGTTLEFSIKLYKLTYESSFHPLKHLTLWFLHNKLRKYYHLCQTPSIFIYLGG